ncbi:MAG TPA: hypothetical protein VE673_14730 [Pseudonocardiaceae bacterium]|nr:hypothetical protein [Pseudonocardiaceae bacterium]
MCGVGALRLVGLPVVSRAAVNTVPYTMSRQWPNALATRVARRFGP